MLYNNARHSDCDALFVHLLQYYNIVHVPIPELHRHLYVYNTAYHCKLQRSSTTNSVQYFPQSI